MTFWSSRQSLVLHVMGQMLLSDTNSERNPLILDCYSVVLTLRYKQTLLSCFNLRARIHR